MTARVACDVQVRFNQPPDELRRFFTTFYYVEVTVPDGGTVTDWLHPEWGNLRFHTGSMLKARTADGRELPKTDFAVTGPSSMAVQFTMGSARMWGIGFLPLGWAKFVPGSSGMFANALLDGHAHPAFASFASLAQTLFGREPDPPAELSRITNHFLACVDAPLPDEARIVAVHEALVDPETASVADLCARAGGNPR
ncbi:MAG: AraC family transcriptional regulator, partial [Novosphingobium sp.]